jgi:hypothetical protein
MRRVTRLGLGGSGRSRGPAIRISEEPMAVAVKYPV